MGLDYNHEVKIKEDVINKLYNGRPDYPLIKRCFKLLSEPDRVFIFKIKWEDDSGNLIANTGYRVQHNSALGPYKGGLRFNKNVTLDTFKSLAFEQTFKNSITGLSLGGGKGGSDFDPLGRSDNEIRRFCRAFTDELYKHIGPDTDVPAGDIGVGNREIGYIFGRYKELTNKHDGTLTGKNVYGSNLRPEATGFGLMYFVGNNMGYLENDTNIVDVLKGKNILISGSGNVAIHAVMKGIEMGANILTVSDITGAVYVSGGICDKLFKILYQMYGDRKLLNEFKDYEKYGARFIPMDVLKTGDNLWNRLGDVLDPDQTVDIALTCATQHEISKQSLESLIKRKVVMVAEGSNFGLQESAIQLCREKGLSYMPGKLSNSGGVMVSQFEMQQNAIKSSWTSKEVDKKLSEYVKNGYNRCRDKAIVEKINFDMAVFAVGFERVYDAMIKLGSVFLSAKL